MNRIKILAALVALSAAGSIDAQESKAPKGTEIVSECRECKPAECAFCINFPKEYDLDLEPLITLGVRITQARNKPDPVSLMSIANELAAYEGASGKKATITAKALTEEALELAERRDVADELKAVAVMVTDGAMKKKFSEAATVAQKRDDEAEAAIKAGEKAKGIRRYLTVRNYSGRGNIRIYVNGRYRGTVGCGRTMRVYVGECPCRTTKLYGRLCGCSRNWGPRYVRQDFNNYTWTLRP